MLDNTDLMPTYRKNALHNLISPELVSPMTMYSLSINPSFNLNNTLKTDAITLRRLLRQIANYSHAVYAVLELSKTGRLHAHGTITFLNKLSIIRFFRFIRSQTYNIEMDTINDIQKWMAYIHKQQTYHQTFLEDLQCNPIYKYNSL